MPRFGPKKHTEMRFDGRNVVGNGASVGDRSLELQIKGIPRWNNQIATNRRFRVRGEERESLETNER